MFLFIYLLSTFIIFVPRFRILNTCNVTVNRRDIIF